MSKLTDFYIHKSSLQEEGKPIDPQWEMLEDQLLKEELLPERFGKEYEEYCRNVPRYIPRLTPWKPKDKLPVM